MASLFNGTDASPIGCKVGKMTLAGKRVTADPRRGQISLAKDAGGLLNMVWRDRVSNVADEPIILFPGDATFYACKSCTTGRVMYLKFSSGRREFFWLQEVDASKDAKLLKDLNAAINGSLSDAMDTSVDIAASPASAAAMASSAGVASEGLEDLVDPDTLEFLRAMPADERLAFAQNLGLPQDLIDGLMNVNGSAAGTPAAPSAPASNTTFAQAAVPPPAPLSFDAGQLAAVLSGAASTAQEPDLADILSPEQLAPLLERPDFVAALAPFLPEGQQEGSGDLGLNVRSPQFRQALAAFSHALESGALTSVVGQLGVNPAHVAQGGGGLKGLLFAIQKQTEEAAKHQ